MLILLCCQLLERDCMCCLIFFLFSFIPASASSAAFLNPIEPGSGTMYHRGIFLSRTLERQMILNWNFVNFNIFLRRIMCWKSFFGKICQLSVMTVLSRAYDSIFTYSFCVVNFIGNYVKISLWVSFKLDFCSANHFRKELY